MCEQVYFMMSGRLPNGRRGLKFVLILLLILNLKSPSQRKAWIEVLDDDIQRQIGFVAFPTEGVD